MANPANSAPALDLAPIHLPQAPSYWPLAWGWWLVIICIFIGLFLLIRLWKHHHQKHQVKKTAMTEIKKAQNANELQNLMRRACLSELPRHQIAGLSGRQWALFLDSQAKIQPSFENNWAIWEQALYQENQTDAQQFSQLKQQTLQWLKKALPLKTQSPKTLDSGVKHV